MKLLVFVVGLTLAFCAPAVTQMPTMIGDGVTDNTAIWNQIISNTCASTVTRKVNIPVGIFRFASPMDGIPCSAKVEGQGLGVTYLMFDYNGLYAYRVVGGIDPYGGGSLRDVTLSVTSAHTIGYAIWAQAQLETDPNVISKNPHGFTIENVIMARHKDAPFTGSWNYCIYADGGLNASPPAGVAPGMRYMRVLHSSCSGWNTVPALAYYAYGTRFDAFDCYIGLVAGQPYVVEGLNDQNTTMVIAGPQNITCPYVHSGT